MVLTKWNICTMSTTYTYSSSTTELCSVTSKIGFITKGQSCKLTYSIHLFFPMLLDVLYIYINIFFFNVTFQVSLYAKERMPQTDVMSVCQFMYAYLVSAPQPIHRFITILHGRLSLNTVKQFKFSYIMIIMKFSFTSGHK